MKPARWLACVVFGALAVGCGNDERIGGAAPPTTACAPVLANATGGRCLDKPTTELALPGLEAPVSVLRDRYGTAHIYATHLEDVFRAQGYLVASDRMPQIELLRRFARGQLAELLGGADPTLLEQDALYRTLGLSRVAQRELDALEPGSEEIRILQAFSDGVNAWLAALRRGEVLLPKEALGLPAQKIPDFTPLDSLSLARFQEWILSESLETELDTSETVDALTSTFRPDASDPAIAARAGLARDVLRFAPADPATVLDGFPDDGAHVLEQMPAKTPKKRAPIARPALSPALRARAHAVSSLIARGKALLGIVGRNVGSNNWAVTGALSSSGRALLASDPHLPLSSPAVFWPTHLVVDDAAHPDQSLELAGMEFPGIPGVILGMNRHIAWGATVAFFDVTDIYHETLTDDGKAVIFNGARVELENSVEPITLPDGKVYQHPVQIVPQHGPILPAFGPDHHALPLDPKAGAMSVRWTGHQVTNEMGVLVALGRAKNVEDVRSAMRGWGPGAQNWMFADDSGNVFYTAESLVPVRDPRALAWDPQKLTGTIPCMPLPGDGSAEWTGFLDEAFVPHLKNPAKGFVATANGDQVGTTLDNDPTNDLLPNGEPGFLACFYDIGFRTGRIQSRLASAAPGSLDLDQMAAIQADERSPLGARLVPRLLAILQLAELEQSKPGTTPGLGGVVASDRYKNANITDLATTLASWRDDSDYAAEPGIDLDTGTPVTDPTLANASKATLVFNAWLTRLLGRVFLDEFAHVPVENGEFSSKHGLDDQIALRALLHLVESDPAGLASYDPASGDSILWDDMATPDHETRSERFVTALLDAVDDLNKALGSDRSKWRWGALHRIAFEPLVPLWLMRIPATNDPKFGLGFPRHGDPHGIDASNFDLTRGLDEDLDMTYSEGPAQRFVVELDPAGPIARNALPGGAIWRKDSPHFSDEAEYWRKNENHPVPFAVSDVLAASTSDVGGERISFKP